MTAVAGDPSPCNRLLGRCGELRLGTRIGQTTVNRSARTAASGAQTSVSEGPRRPSNCIPHAQTGAGTVPPSFNDNSENPCQKFSSIRFLATGASRDLPGPRPTPSGCTAPYEGPRRSECRQAGLRRSSAGSLHWVPMGLRPADPRRFGLPIVCLTRSQRTNLENLGGDPLTTWSNQLSEKGNPAGLKGSHE